MAGGSPDSNSLLSLDVAASGPIGNVQRGVGSPQLIFLFVAQSGRVLALEASCRSFKSNRVDQRVCFRRMTVGNVRSGSKPVKFYALLAQWSR